MFSNPMNEPIDHRSEMDEGEKGGREFFVAGGDAAHGFDAAKEVFDVMTVAIVSAVEAGGQPATAFRRNANSECTGRATVSAAEVVGVKALVRHGKGATVPIHDGRQLGVQPALGPSHRLGRLATRGVGPMLMQFDLRAVQMPPTHRAHAGLAR